MVFTDGNWSLAQTCALASTGLVVVGVVILVYRNWRR